MRQPINVLVLPYYNLEDEIHYAIFKRSDGDIYQGLAGGVEDNETPLIAAKREAFEEAKIPFDSFYLPLDTTSSLPAVIFEDHIHWPEETYVVKEVCFGVEVLSKALDISLEHENYKWMNYEDAHHYLTFESNKIALWELHERLKK
ncbi:MAG: NUDIX domain-containing protein [Clostridia bacterium]|nr:NUDIX domain-containing protein [Clostridia bacterium]